MSYIKSIDLNGILNEVENLRNYYKGFGIRIPVNSNLNRCLTSIKTVVNAWNKRDFEFPKTDDYKSIMNDSIEIFRLSNATSYLQKDNVNIKRNLINIVKGSIDVKDSSFSVAKNYAFELIVAGQLAKARLTPELKEPDIQFKFNGNLISIACKKIYSIKNLGKQISEARKQIQNKNEIGIITLCLDYFFDHSKIFWVSNKEEMVNSLIAFLKNFANLHRPLIIRKSNSDKVMAVMLSVSSVSNIEKEWLFTMSRQSILIPVKIGSDKHFDLIKRLVSVLDST